MLLLAHTTTGIFKKIPTFHYPNLYFSRIDHFPFSSSSVTVIQRWASSKSAASVETSKPRKSNRRQKVSPVVTLEPTQTVATASSSLDSILLQPKPAAPDTTTLRNILNGSHRSASASSVGTSMKRKVIPFVIDLECTTERYPSEIIELAALEIDPDTFQSTRQFQSYIRPTVNVILSNHCKDLTKIKQSYIDPAGTFPQVWQKFIDWVMCSPSATAASPEETFRQVVVCAWGNMDRPWLNKECERHSLPFSVSLSMDIMRESCAFLNFHTKGQFTSKHIKLHEAATQLGVEVNTQSLHGALYDAKLAYEVFQQVMTANNVLTEELQKLLQEIRTAYPNSYLVPKVPKKPSKSSKTIKGKQGIVDSADENPLVEASATTTAATTAVVDPRGLAAEELVRLGYSTWSTEKAKKRT